MIISWMKPLPYSQITIDSVCYTCRMVLYIFSMTLYLFIDVEFIGVNVDSGPACTRTAEYATLKRKNFLLGTN